MQLSNKLSILQAKYLKKRNVIQLGIAVRNGDIDQIKYLIKQGADVNAKDRNGNTALHGAVYKGHKEIVNLLLVREADINAKNYKQETVFHLAALKGHTAIVKALVIAGVDINDTFLYSPAINNAIEKGKTELIDLVRLLMFDIALLLEDKLNEKNLVKSIMSYYANNLQLAKEKMYIKQRNVQRKKENTCCSVF